MHRSALYVYTLIHTETKAVSDEIFALIGSQGFLVHWEIDNAGLKHDAFIEYSHLAHLIPERFLAKKHFIVDNSYGPYIYLCRNHRLLV